MNDMAYYVRLIEYIRRFYILNVSHLVIKVQTSMWSKVVPHVKKNPYIINQNHIFSTNYCEVISG